MTTAVPIQPNLAESMRRRLEILRRTENTNTRKLAYLVCKNDPIVWINDFVWTYDPRLTPSTIPFDLFPKQIEFIHWLLSRYQLKEDGLAEKSRDVGFTWLCAAFMLHQWLFQPGFKGTFGSRKESLVDRMGDPDTIFEKMRLILQSLPQWMTPAKAQDSYMRLINLDTGSSITGEAGDNMGRGGRSSLYIIDEAAFIERPQKVDAAVSQNSDVKIYVSTPNGSGNPFAQKRLSGVYPVFTFRWQDDPRKDEAWYEKQKATLDPVIVASEIDIDYSASIEGIYIPAPWVRAAIDYPITSPVAKTAGLDVATTGKNRNVLVIRQGNRVLDIQSWQGLNTTETAFKTKEIMDRLGVTHLNFDVDGVGAGVAGTLETTPNLKFTFTPVHGSGSPSATLWVGENQTSKEKFHNQRAEHYGLLRERFKKTYEVINAIADYSASELISIPNHPSLIAQISQPLRKFTSAGKILLESKDDMRKRGIESPDFADALVYAFIDRPDSWESAQTVGDRRVGYSLSDW